MSRRVIYPLGGSAPAAQLVESYRTWAALTGALTAEGVAAHTTAALFGPAARAALFSRTAAGGVELESRGLALWTLDGTELPQGATTDGSNPIERFDTAAAGTWGTPGSTSTGGLVLNGSGALVLPLLGMFDPASCWISARIVLDSLVPANNMAWGVGMMSSARTKGVGVCADYTSSVTRWDRRVISMTSAPTLATSGSGGASYDLEGLVEGSEVVAAFGWGATNRATNYGSYFGTIYRADEPSGSQSGIGSANSNGLFTAATDQEFFLWASAAAGTISMRVVEISIGAMVPPA